MSSGREPVASGRSKLVRALEMLAVPAARSDEQAQRAVLPEQQELSRQVRPEHAAQPGQLAWQQVLRQQVPLASLRRLALVLAARQSVRRLELPVAQQLAQVLPALQGQRLLELRRLKFRKGARASPRVQLLPSRPFLKLRRLLRQLRLALIV